MTTAGHDRAGGEVPVWDLFVRVSHWVVAVGFAVAYVTEGEPLIVHVWAGYLIAALVLLRVIWGFVGPRRARFSDFVYGPPKVVDYLVKLVGFRAERHLGHSPAGGAMVVALLVMLAGATLTGMALLADTKGEGPLSPWISQTIVEEAAAPTDARESGEDDDEDEHERRRGPRSDYEEIHELFVNLTLILVILHVAGVVLASVAHKEKLVKSMITGRKRPL